MIKIKYDEFLVWLIIILIFGLIQHWMEIMSIWLGMGSGSEKLTIKFLFNDNMLFFCTSLIIAELYECLQQPELKPYAGKPAYFLVYFLIPMGLVFFITFIYFKRDDMNEFIFAKSVLSSFILSLLYACFVKLKINIFTKL